MLRSSLTIWATWLCVRVAKKIWCFGLGSILGRFAGFPSNLPSFVSVGVGSLVGSLCCSFCHAKALQVRNAKPAEQSESLASSCWRLQDAIFALIQTLDETVIRRGSPTHQRKLRGIWRPWKFDRVPKDRFHMGTGCLIHFAALWIFQERVVGWAFKKSAGKDNHRLTRCLPTPKEWKISSSLLQTSDTTYRRHKLSKKSEEIKQKLMNIPRL